MVRGLETILCGKNNLGMFILEKRKFNGQRITVFKYLKGYYVEGGNCLFVTSTHCSRVKQNGKFRLEVKEVRKSFLSCTKVEWVALGSKVSEEAR